MREQRRQQNVAHLHSRPGPSGANVARVRRCGLSTGKFDWEVQWVPDDLRVDGATRLEGPSMFEAFRQQLGIKFEPTRDRVDVLVIDRAERPQTD